MVNAHGALGSIEGRSIEEIAEYISTIEQATGKDSSVRKVSLIPCDLKGKYAIKLLSKLRKRGILLTHPLIH
jgi:hypothetical protein